MSATPTVVLVSFWRNDAQRQLEARVAHLLAKVAPEGMRLRHLWAVGDSIDATAEALWFTATAKTGWPDDPHPDMDLKVMTADTGIEGEDTPSRRLRLAATATRAFAAIRETDDWVLLHESDLKTPVDVVGRFQQALTIPGLKMYWPCPIAGWPLLGHLPGAKFYDLWAYAHVNGHRFDADEPRPSDPFEVASFGSCWLAPASLVRNRVLGLDCVVDLCRQWRSEGVHLWVDPTVTVVQPTDLWTPTAFD